jgi:hypothetical protein
MMAARRILLGILVTVVGAFLMVDRIVAEQDLGAVLVHSWPLLFVDIYLTYIVLSLKSPPVVTLLLILLGATVAFLIMNIALPGSSDNSLVWPFTLLIIGLWISLATPSEHRDSPGTLTMAVVLRQMRYAHGPRNLSHARITILLGVGELDLRNSQIVNSATIDTIVVFGKLAIIPPEAALASTHERSVWQLGTSFFTDREQRVRDGEQAEDLDRSRQPGRPGGQLRRPARRSPRRHPIKREESSYVPILLKINHLGIFGTVDVLSDNAVAPHET